MKEQWQGFKGTKWQDEVDVRDFIQNNYTPYDGDESFLVGPSKATEKLWDELQKLQKEERSKMVYWIWKRKSFLVSQPINPDIWIKI